MSDLNKVMVIGRLGKDPDLRTMPNGKAVVSLSLATSEKWKDKQTGEKKEATEWHNIVAFERTAEIIAEYTRKGSQLFVEGRLRTRKWTDKEGKDRYTTEIVANNIQLFRGPETPQKPAAAPKPAPKPAPVDDGGFDDDIGF